MAVAAVDMSADEYLATPESRPGSTELIYGTVVVNDPKIPHQRAQVNVLLHLRRWIDDGQGRGYVSTPTDIWIDDTNVFAPDVWWVAEERRPSEDQLDLDGLPDLVVEIRSHSTWARDLMAKLPTYDAAGVAEAWYVDTESRTVLVFRRSSAEVASFDVRQEAGEGEVLTSPTLEDFALPVEAIFTP